MINMIFILLRNYEKISLNILFLQKKNVNTSKNITHHISVTN